MVDSRRPLWMIDELKDRFAQIVCVRWGDNLVTSHFQRGMGFSILNTLIYEVPTPSLQADRPYNPHVLITMASLWATDKAAYSTASRVIP